MIRSLGKRVRYGYIGVQMMRGITDYTASLTGDMTFVNVGANGNFQFDLRRRPRNTHWSI